MSGRISINTEIKKKLKSKQFYKTGDWQTEIKNNTVQVNQDHLLKNLACQDKLFCAALNTKKVSEQTDDGFPQISLP